MKTYPAAKDNTFPRLYWLRISSPVVITCHIFYRDPVNIAYVIAGGLDKGLFVSAYMAGLAGGIFFIGYRFSEPSDENTAVRGRGKTVTGGSQGARSIISILVRRITPSYPWLFLPYLPGGDQTGILPAVLIFISHHGVINTYGNSDRFCNPDLTGNDIVAENGWPKALPDRARRVS